MLEWQWPYLFLLLPLPLIARWLLPEQERDQGALRVPFYQLITDLDQRGTVKTASNWLNPMLLWAIWCCLVVAIARPSLIGDPVSLPLDRRDMMLAVDISQSMQEADMRVGNRYATRVDAVKAVVGEFVKKRKGDRLGLILFGQQGYLQTPLTYDSATVNQQLQEAQLGFAGNATAIGDAIGLAIKRLRDRPADSRVLILLTDGANSAGTDPLQAVDIAIEAGIKIHTVGVGADEKIVRDFFGRNRVRNPSADLDEKTLTTISQKTGGQYFRARDPSELQKIYAELDRLEPIPEEQTFRPSRSLTFVPILFALLCSLLLVVAMRLSTGSR